MVIGDIKAALAFSQTDAYKHGITQLGPNQELPLVQRVISAGDRDLAPSEIVFEYETLTGKMTRTSSVVDFPSLIKACEAMRQDIIKGG